MNMMAALKLELVFLIVTLISTITRASIPPLMSHRQQSAENSLFRWSDSYITPFISEIPTNTVYNYQQGVVRLGFVNNSVIYCDDVYLSESLVPTNPIKVNTSQQLRAESLILKNGFKYGASQVIFEGKIRPFSAAFDVYLPLENTVAYDKQILTNMTFQSDLRKILDIPMRFLFYSEILIGIPQVTPSPQPYSYSPYSYSPTYSYISYSSMPTPTPSVSFYNYYSPTW
ncbi:uncharacterized protein Gasu_41530 [Galdieria sulphuraria]|uniref:Uncharacterized protein n=1 Tax=Galdieria sulphuraria TaxID=130081 RepID=M2WWC0_GALSU|nr:uncharacterized protein Gasu_41530 [Galdieria sulphuraria]EME28305.1 hypothetical protein Gasu_41530 [Galdieria sulphuraria]|eukprot:XP_005704825.1 hypothetical protein Gasu_41530 [Galdieria sulphuraria]